MNIEQLGTMFNYLLIGGALAIFNLWLEKFDPPIKKQWIGLAVFIAGSLGSWYMLNNALYGFLISGAVYYKKELAIEIKEILDAVRHIENDVTNKTHDEVDKLVETLHIESDKPSIKDKQ